MPEVPVSLTTVAVVAGASTLAVAGTVVTLPLIGFAASGVVAGSTAAVLQSTIGNVLAGSTFASLQSAGVLGLAASTKVGIAIVGGTIGGLVRRYI